MGRYSIMTGVELRGTEISEFTIAWGQVGLVVDCAGDMSERGKKINIVPE